MTTIDDRRCENSQRNEDEPMTTFTAGDMSRQRNAEPTALQNVADTERLRAAAALVSARAVSLTEDPRCPT